VREAPLFGLSAITGVIVYPLLIAWWFFIAGRQHRTS